MIQKGTCQQKKRFFSLISVTDKGQIAIPIDLRRELKINKGDKLVVIKRDDNKGFNLLKVETISNFLDKLSKD